LAVGSDGRVHCKTPVGVPFSKSLSVLQLNDGQNCASGMETKNKKNKTFLV
jgi:hypothetical protein